ncbi:MAG: transferase [Bacteroidetes bacterium]|nr:MAG: transferase [Bacteroidota bacterium]
MKEIIIFGTGKIAEAVHYYLKNESDLKVVAATVDKEYMPDEDFVGVPVVPFEEVQKQYPPDQYGMFVALGYHELNTLRAAKLKEAKEKGYQIVSYVDKNSGVLKDTEYGENCFIMHNVAIHPKVKFGNNVFVWSGAVICHHTIIEDNCWLTAGSNIMGGVVLGENTFVAGNAMISHSVTVGKRCFIGANTLVTKDLKDEQVVVSNSTPVFRLNSKQFLKMSTFS